MTSSAAEEPDLRLKTLEVARFVSQGFLRFDSLVPEPLNERFMKEAEQGPPVGGPAGTPLSETYRGSVMVEILRLPKVVAVIQSLRRSGLPLRSSGHALQPARECLRVEGHPGSGPAHSPGFDD